MIERREQPGFALEASETVGILGERGWQYLERDLAVEPQIAGTIDLAHAARTNRGQDLERSNAASLGEGHQMSDGILGEIDSVRGPRVRTLNG
jgi:hypothetical protein